MMAIGNLAIFLNFALASIAAPKGFLGQNPLSDPANAPLPQYRSVKPWDGIHAFDTETRELLALHRLLVEAQSITDNELAVGTALAAYLRSSQHGVSYTVETQRVEKGRHNIFAYPGKNRDAKTLVTSHIDTVPPFIPYSFQLNRTHPSSSLISGRGTVDAKGSVAAQIFAVSNILRHATTSSTNPPSLALLFVVGEEVGGEGMRLANDLSLKPSTVIFGEPTDNILASGHKGVLGFTVHVTGHAAHSGYPWLGVSANEVLTSLLFDIKKLENVLPSSEKFGETTINIGKIEGGVAANVIAESASAKFLVRIASGEPAAIKSAILEVTNAVAQSYPGAEVEVEFTKGYGPVNIDADVEGFENQTVNYGTDIPNLEKAVEGQKRYLYGPGSILVAHGKDERLTVGELVGAVRDYEKLILATQVGS
ncbi:MAG: hypothetical protein M1820_005040 [Bogoriella megaspora]|nr:MAG: hypothetical protein M1820_005040 [Bogoriella megaspora]